MNISLNAHTDLSMYKPIVLCKKCKYFISSQSVCSKFKKQSLIDGKIEFPTVDEVRNSNNFCGIGAKYFEDKIEQ